MGELIKASVWSWELMTGGAVLLLLIVGAIRTLVGFSAKQAAKTAIKTYAQRHIEQMKAELQHGLEGYKASLRKTEFLFEKRYEAAVQLFEIRDKQIPHLYGKDADWYEVLEHVAQNLTEVKSLLDGYLVKYAPALPDDDIAEIQGFATKAREMAPEGAGPEPTTAAVDAASSIMNGLEELFKKQKQELWVQTVG